MMEEQDIPMPPRRAWHTQTLVLLVVVIGVFYFWTAWSCGASLIVPKGLTFSGNSPDLCPSHYGYYNLLTDSFLAGQVSLQVQPPREMQALDNPYDPVKNKPYRLADVSYYKGKYYLYFGPTPAVLLFAPWRALGIGNMSEPLAVFIFATAGLVFGLLLLRHMVCRYLPATPLWLRAAAVVCVGLCNLMPFLLRTPIVYHVAIAGGHCLLMAGLWLLFLGYGSPRRRLVLFALSSLALGLGVGARPTVVLSAGVVLAVYMSMLRRDHGWRFRAAWREAICLAGPMSLCVFLLGLYNYVRFDSWTEFGWRYLTSGLAIGTLPSFSMSNIVPSLYFALLSPAKLTYIFPFLCLDHGPEAYPGVLPAGYEGPEIVGGMLTNIPVTLMLLASPVLLWKERKDRRGLFLLLCCLGGLGLGTMTFIAYMIPGSSMRYLADSLPLLLTASLLTWFYLASGISRLWVRACVHLVAVLFVLYGCLFSLCISMTGSYGLLQTGSPSTYYAIERACLPASNFLGRFQASKTGVDVNISYPGGAISVAKDKSLLCISRAKPMVIRLHCPELLQMNLSIRFTLGPDGPAGTHRTIRFQQNGYPDVFLPIECPFEGTLTMPLTKGMNLISIDTLEDAAVARLDSFAPKVVGVDILDMTFDRP